MFRENSIRNTGISNATNKKQILSTIIMLFLVEIVNSDFNVAVGHIESYCRQLRTCVECKRADYRCDWCHNVGCTSAPQRHCPAKAFTNMWLRRNHPRTCSYIHTESPIFIPTDIRQNIKVSVSVDDASLTINKLSCEIRLDQKVIVTAAQLHSNNVYCDTVEIRILRQMSVGFLRVYWGGAEPYSNKILLIAYKCHKLADSCAECSQVAADTEGFRCGWCQETGYCSIVEQCPRQHGYWVTSHAACNDRSNSSSSLLPRNFFLNSENRKLDTRKHLAALVG